MKKSEDRPVESARYQAMRKKLQESKKDPFLSPTGRWMKGHEEAREFFEVWMDMASKGEAGLIWTPTRIFHELVGEYGLPFSDASSFSRWASRAYGKKYQEAVESMRSR